jgi:predicted ATP-grasp superfamily ATP-dependent carboligase
MIKKRIFILEFVSSGGFNKIEIPISLFCEGYGMLRSIIMDFKSLNFEISTMLDYRIFPLSNFLPVDELSIIRNMDNFLKKFKTKVKESEYTFIIAPESSNILYKLTKIVKKSNRILLSTNLEGIRLGMSKFNTYYFFKGNKTTAPKTYLIPIRKKQLDIDFILQKFNILKKPIVIKPEDGIGAESIYYFETQYQIKHFFQEFRHKVEYGRKYIIQEFIEGKDLSASLIGVPYIMDSQIKNPLLLSINAQNVNIKNSNYYSEYYGGYTPIENYQKTKNNLSLMLEKINFSEFSGYFGIDFIRTTDSKLYFIEINPRLTTSYIGLRNVINQNPAKLILDSKLNCLKHYEVKYLHHSLFSRVEMDFNEKINNEEFSEELIDSLVRKIPEFVTPPISFNNSNHFTCFIATKSKDLSTSKERMNDIKKSLGKLGFENIK